MDAEHAENVENKSRFKGEIMKKAFALLTLLSLASVLVFAGVDFSGELQAGYVFNYDDGGKGEWDTFIWGQDGDDTNTTKLNLGVADEDGLWSVNIEGNPTLDDSGAVSGDLTIDLAKIIAGPETEWSTTLGLLVNDEMTGLRAYRRTSLGNNYDRVRTAPDGLWTSLGFGYGDLVQVQVAGSPETIATDDTNNIEANSGDVVVSALFQPVSGLKISADWALKGKFNGDSEMKKVLRDGTDIQAGGNGIIGAAFDLNFADLLGLDFNLGISATERYAFGTDGYTTYKEDDNGDTVVDKVYAPLAGYNTFAANIYGGFGLVDFALEYALHTIMPETGDTENISLLYAELGFNVVENLGLMVYGGASDLKEPGDTYFVGGTVDYTHSGITYALNVEYACPDGIYSESPEYDHTGLMITPHIKVAF